MKNMKMLLAIALIAVVVVTKAEAQKQPPPPPPPPAKINQENANPRQQRNAFLKDNPTVADIYWKKENLVVVFRKDGKIERYNSLMVLNKKTF